jgi:imidazolonepropionase-like amidohydrolase
MFTRHGFTTVYDLGSPWRNTRDLRDRILKGEVAGPQIRMASQALEPEGARPVPDLIVSIFALMKPVPNAQVKDAATAAAATRRIMADGMNGLKIYAKSPPLAEATMAAAIVEAHRSPSPVFVHCDRPADLIAAIQAGADVIVHTTPTQPWDAQVVAARQGKRVAFNPTLNVWTYYSRHDPVAQREATRRAVTGQLRQWVSSGGPVIFGTDLGAVDTEVAEEYALMAEAGMEFRQILASLTTEPADRLASTEGPSGRIAINAPADLAVLKSDPAVSLSALTAVRYTIRAGKIIYP